MSDIQKARDVLAKLRKGTTPGPWRVSKSGNWVTSDADDIARALGDSPLIVGTAGNPDLLDAIDEALAAADRYNGDDFSILLAIEPIVAAIIAANERMSA